MNLIDIKKQLFDNNMSTWNDLWNKDIKSVINIINIENIVFAGQAINYKGKGNKFLGKFFLYLFPKDSLK